MNKILESLKESLFGGYLPDPHECEYLSWEDYEFLEVKIWDDPMGIPSSNIDRIMFPSTSRPYFILEGRFNDKKSHIVVSGPIKITVILKGKENGSK